MKKLSYFLVFVFCLMTNLSFASSSLPPYIPPTIVPVCSGGNFGGEFGESSVGVEAQGFKTMYCARGAKQIRLIYTNTYSNSSNDAETDGTTAFNFNAGITVWYAPWQSTTTYQIGQTTTYNNAVYTALAVNTNSVPNAVNTNWTSAGTASLNPYIPVTCNGNRTCSVPLVTNSGTLAAATQGYIVTDPIAINVPVGGFIQVITFVNNSGNSGFFYPSVNGSPLASESFSQASSIGDRTLTGAYTATTGGVGLGPTVAPIAVVGIPQVYGSTVCGSGDSISVSLAGNGYGATTPTLVSGGSNFSQADVGQIGYINNAGASAGAVGDSAGFIIKAVNSGSGTGAVTNLATVDNGSYTNPSYQTTQTLPVGTQSVSFAGVSDGSGVQISGSFTGGAHNVFSKYAEQGWIQNGLDAAGIPFVWFGRSSDTLANWITRDYVRLGIAKASGCSSWLNELGVNDAASQSAATIEANLATFSAQVMAIPTIKGFYQTTITPQIVVSTDGFLTQGNQTANASNPTIASLNSVIRSVPSWETGYIDIATLETSGVDNGLYITDGVTHCKVSCDGIHPRHEQQTINSNAITAYGPNFQ